MVGTSVRLRSVAQASSLVAAALCIAPPPAARAAPPEYMRLRPRAGQTLEISGIRNALGVFVATGIESLPEPRRPSVRAAIDSVDVQARALTILGRRVRVPESTESEDPDSLRIPFEKLAAGRRVEVAVRVSDTGEWIAKRLRVHGVKPSDKIKGTITRVQVDGVPPDTVEISGFPILLDERTDVDSPLGTTDPRTRELFGHVTPRPDRAGTLAAGGALWIVSEYRAEVLSKRDLDLSAQFPGDERDGRPEARLTASAYGGASWRARVQARVRRRFVLSSDRELESGEVEAHLTQLDVLWRSGARRGLAVQFGRSRFEDPREWIWDEYLDGVRLVAFGSGPLVLETAVLHAVHPIKPSRATWTDAFAMARWYTSPRSHAALWVLARSDRDAVRERQPVWAGLRWWGRVKHRLRPWVDVAVLRGEDKHRALRAWALDAGGTLHFPELPGAPAASAAWAVGSGDDSSGDGVDGNFRQTGYEDNWARLGGVAAIRYYGELLDPELCNLRIATLGLGVRPIPDASIEVVYHHYRQHVADDRLRSHNLIDPPARPNGQNAALGWGLDVVGTTPLLWGVARARWTSAFFRPGGAFSPRQEDALLHKLGMTAEF